MQRRAHCLAWLKQRYPQLFNPDQPKPLQIGIDKALKAAAQDEGQGREISRALIREVLGRWVRREPYLQALCQGRVRYDLHGQEAGAISTHQRAIAGAKLHTGNIRNKPSPGQSGPV